MTTRAELSRQVDAWTTALSNSQRGLDKARAALKAFDDRAPAGTLLSLVTSGTVIHAIRLNLYYTGGRGGQPLLNGPGWMTIFNDGSGSFYADSEGGWAEDRFTNVEEVYRP